MVCFLTSTLPTERSSWPSISTSTSINNIFERSVLIENHSTQGHEGCGEIVSIGSQVDEEEEAKKFKLKLGDLVAIFAVPGCGATTDCPECSRDLPQLCTRGLHHGIGQDGSFAEYIAIDSRAAVPLPQGK